LVLVSCAFTDHITYPKDGGGTKTVVVCIEDGTNAVLGRGIAGGSNHNSVGEEKAGAAIKDSIQAALANSGCCASQGTSPKISRLIVHRLTW